MFDKIKQYYTLGLWNLERIYNVVGKAITPEQFEAITGLPYEKESDDDE